MPVQMTESQREVVTANIGLAYSHAFRRAETIKCLSEEDLLELSWIGLCHASQKHDPARSKFSTFAIWCMRSEVNAAVKGLSRKRRCPTGKMFGMSDTPDRGKVDPAFNDIEIEDWLDCFK